MKIEGNYILDLDNIIKFCFDNDDKTNDSEITEVYVTDENSKNLTLTSKQLREVKSGDVSSKQTVKYDLIKTFISDLMDMDDILTFGDSIIINTMLSEGLLKQVNE